MCFHNSFSFSLLEIFFISLRVFYLVFSIISVTFTLNIQTMVTINLESGNVLYRFDNGYEIIAQRNRTTVAEFRTRKFVPLNDIAEHIKGHGG